MATKSSSSSSSSTQSSQKGTSTNFLLNILSYVAVCVCGLVMFITQILAKVGVSAAFFSVLQAIADAIGWAILCVLSFRYIRRRKKIWMWVVWAIAVVMIVVSIILGIF